MSCVIINNKMIDDQLNNTLEEASFKGRRQTATFDDIVSINYEHEFSYLNDAQFSGQHLQLSHIQIDPSDPPFALTFFQQFYEQPTSDFNSIPSQITRHPKKKHKRKIVEVKVSKFGSFEGEIVRLPKQQSDRVVKVQFTQQEDIKLQGKLSKTEGINKIQLLDKSQQTVYQMSFVLKNSNKKNQSQYDNLSQEFEEAYSAENVENQKQQKQQNHNRTVKNNQMSQNESFHVHQSQNIKQSQQNSKYLISQQNQDVNQSFHLKNNYKKQPNKKIIKPPPNLIQKEQKPKALEKQQNSVSSYVNVDINKTESHDFVQSDLFIDKKAKQSLPIDKQPQTQKDNKKVLIDSEQDQKIQKHTPPKFSTSFLLQQALNSSQINEKQPTKLSRQKPVSKHQVEKKEAQAQRQLQLQKYRELTNQKQKIQLEQNQQNKKPNRYAFKTIKTLSPEHQRDCPQNQDPSIHQRKNTSNIYKMPVDIISNIRLRSPESKTTHTNKSYRKDPVNFVNLEGKSYLQKFIKASLRNQLEPIERQSSFQIKDIYSNPTSIQVSQPNSRKTGFIKSHRSSLPKQQQQSFIQKQLIQQQRQNNVAASFKHFNTKALKMNANILEIKVSGKMPNKKSLSKVLDEQYAPPISKTQKTQPVQKKINQQKRDTIPSRKQSTEKSTAPRIAVKSINKKNVQAQTENRKLLQLEQSSNEQTSEEPSLPQEKELAFDIIINNLSVNLYTKVFGRKYMEMTLGSDFYTTDYLHGSHLLWVGKGYLFKQVSSSKQIEFSLKCQADGQLKILGRAKLTVAELLLNYRQSFYQTYLFTPQHELLAVIIVGYQILNHFTEPKYPTVSRHSSNSPVTHPVLPKTTKKTKTKPMVMPPVEPSLSQSSFEQQKQTKYKKYKGGYNIRLGRASRFVTEPVNDEPGPGHYRINSEFERHTVSRKDK